MDYAIQDLTDGERVVLCANIQDTSEYEIFRHAHMAWYARAVDELVLCEEFSRYLLQGHAPPWVRHYTRNFLQSEQYAITLTCRHAAHGGLLERCMENRFLRFLLG